MKLYRFTLSFYHSANLSGIFTVNDEEEKLLKELDGQNIYLGEVAGKHSEVTFDFAFDDLEFITDDYNVIEIIEKYIGKQSGFNWRYYLLEYPKEQAYEDGWRWGYYGDYDTIEECLANENYVGILAETVTQAFEKGVRDKEKECAQD